MTKYIEATKVESDVDIEYEKRFLKDFIQSLKILKGEHGRKMELVGALVERIAEALECKSDALYFAGYYANVGLLMIEKIISRADFISNEHERNIIKDHVHYSANFLEIRGLHSSAQIVELHHEKPNAKGYFSKMNKDRNSAIVNIADEFVGLSSETSYRPHRVKKIAVAKTMAQYEATSIFSKEERVKIEGVLNNFYHIVRSVQ